MSKGKFALGAIFGAVVGVVAGVLAAPKSGKETRKDLKNKAESLKRDAMDKAEQCCVDGCDVIDCVKHEAENVAKKAVKEANELKNRTENAVDGAKKGFENKR